MIARAPAWAATVFLIAAACTGNEPSAPTDGVPEQSSRPEDTAAPTSPPTTAPASPTTEATGPPPGRLVVVDEFGEVVATDPDGANRVVITRGEEDGGAFFQPSWSPGSEYLAWGEAGTAGVGLAISRLDGSERSLTPMLGPPFYLHWAPDGRHIAALHDGRNGIELELVAVATARTTFAGAGVPFYISWSPDSQTIVAHIGADRLATIDTTGTINELGVTGAGYQAPQWTPDGIVHLSEGELRILRESESDGTLAEVEGVVTFVVNPQGTQLAIQSFAEDAPGLTVSLQRIPAVRPNVVAIVDLSTGDTTIAVNERVLAFFWSPDGDKLLILRGGESPGIVDAAVWDGNRTENVVSFDPSDSFVRSVLPFFQQYAQSYQPWAPDSSAFAFAGAVGGEGGIWVKALDDSAPVRVSGGSWVSWSDR